MNFANPADGARRDVTELLHGWSRGEPGAADLLADLVYAQIRAMAGKHVRGSGSAAPLEATELAHELFVRLLESDVDWRDRRHFFGVVSTALRNILIDSVRARGSEKRGGGQIHVTLSDAAGISADCSNANSLHEALLALREHDERKHEIVEFHYLLGLKREEIAAAIGISVPTVDRELRFAKAWLREQVQA